MFFYPSSTCRIDIPRLILVPSAHTQSGWGWLKKLESMALSGAEYWMAVRVAFPSRYTFQHTLFYWHRYFRFFPKFFLYHFCPFFLWDLGHAKDWVVLSCVPRLFHTCIAEPGPSPSSAWAFGPQRINGPSPRIIEPHNSPSKPCCPTSWLERRILVIPNLYYSSFNSALY